DRIGPRVEDRVSVVCKNVSVELRLLPAHASPAPKTTESPATSEAPAPESTTTSSQSASASLTSERPSVTPPAPHPFPHFHHALAECRVIPISGSEAGSRGSGNYQEVRIVHRHGGLFSRHIGRAGGAVLKPESGDSHFGEGCRRFDWTPALGSGS